MIAMASRHGASGCAARPVRPTRAPSGANARPLPSARPLPGPTPGEQGGGAA